MLGKQTTLTFSGCLNTVLGSAAVPYFSDLLYSPADVFNLWIYHLFFFFFSFSFLFLFFFFFFYTWQLSQVSAVIVYFALYIELNVICLHKAMAKRIEAKPHELPGQILFALHPPSPRPPFTSLIFICAHFLSWP